MAEFSHEPNPNENNDQWVALRCERAIDYGSISGEDVTRDAHHALGRVLVALEKLREAAGEGHVGVGGPSVRHTVRRLFTETITFDREIDTPPFKISEERKIPRRNPAREIHTFSLNTLLDCRDIGSPVPRKYIFEKGYKDKSDPEGRRHGYSAELVMSKMKDGTHEWSGTIKDPFINRLTGRSPNEADPLTVYDLEQMDKDLLFALHKIQER